MLTKFSILLKFQDDFNIPTIAQKIFYHGEELSDNSATVQTLGILSHDFLDLREENEDVNIFSDSEDESPKKTRRSEGRGFGGTLLGGSLETDHKPHQGSDSDHAPTVKPCSACTFENALDVSKCTICDTPFASELQLV